MSLRRRRAAPPAEGAVVWIVGRPASGKTTLAEGLIAALRRRGVAVLWLDSDDLRPHLTPSPTFDETERDRFYGAVAHLAELCVRGGVLAVISATAPRAVYRRQLRAKVSRFVEIYLDCADDELTRRDPKGLYAAARRGRIKTLPGINAPFETPERPDLVCDTAAQSAEETLKAALDLLAERFGV